MTIFKRINQLILIISVFFNSNISFAEEKIRIIAGEWPPYISEKLDGFGSFSKVVTEAFRIEGVEVKYEFYPWARAYELAKRERAGGAIGWFKTGKRSLDFYFSSPVIIVETVFFHLRDLKFSFRSIGDLKDYRIGNTRYYFYGSEMERAIRKGDLNPFISSNDLVGLRNIIHGRIDIFPLAKKVGLFLIKEKFPLKEQKKLTFHPRALSKDSVHIIFSKISEKNIVLHHLFNKGLAKLKEKRSPAKQF